MNRGKKEPYMRELMGDEQVDEEALYSSVIREGKQGKKLTKQQSNTSQNER